MKTFPLFQTPSGKRWSILFLIFTIGFAVLIVIFPRVGQIDDFIFLRTLQAGKFMLYYADSFPYYDFLSQGRFMPFLSMEYNLFGIFSNEPSPFWYFFYHAIQFLIFMFLMVRLIEKTTSNNWLIFGIPILILFIPGVATGWIRLQNAERNILFYFAALSLSYSAYLEKKKLIYAVLSVIIASCAIFSKETAFIAIGALALSHLYLSWKTSDRKSRLLDYALGIAALSYVAVYIFYIIPNLGSDLYSEHTGDLSVRTMIVLRNFVNYAFFSDPILLLLLLPLFVERLYRIFIRHEEAHPLYDALLAAAAAYTISFSIALNAGLGMFVSYYLAPTYALAIPPMIHFLRNTMNRFWRALILITAFLMVVNIIPAGLHTISHYKHIPVNFNKMLDFLVEDIKTHEPNKQVNIFIDGVDRSDGRTVYFILAEYLRFRGLSPQKFDLKSAQDLPANAIDYSRYIPRISLPFSVFEKKTADHMTSGDYLIVGPQSHLQVNDSYIASRADDYELVFKTQSPLAIPNFDLKALTKYAAIAILPENKRAFIQSENIAEWPDYYVFVKK